MKRLHVSGRQLAALLCAAVGLLVMGFVLLQHQAWLQVLPSSSPPVFNVGLLSLASARLVWDAHRRARLITRLAALLVLVLPAAVLAQIVFGFSLGIDWPRIHQALPDTANPGRMAPNSCVAFMCFGAAVALIQDRPAGRWVRGLIMTLLLGGLLLGLSGLAGYLLDLEALYRVMDYNKMSIVTSVVLVTVGAALWIAMIRLEPPKRFEQQENRITATAVAVLSLVAVLSGMTTFAVLQDGFKESVAREAGETARGQAIAFAHSLEQDIESAQDVARHLDLRKLLVRLDAQPNDAEALAELREVVESFSVYDFTAVSVYLSNGHPLMEVGEQRMGQADVRLPIEGEFTWLLWDNGLLLRTRTEVVHQGRTVGVLVSEMRLHMLTELMQDLQQNGHSGDLLLCSRVGGQAVCMPSRFYAANKHIDIFRQGRVEQPIARALLGETGSDIVKDLRGERVQSGYSQLGTFNLGMEVKTDVSELYAPLKARLNIVFGVVVMFVALGTWLLRSRVHPLAERVVADQRRMQAAQVLLADKEQRLRDVTNNIPAMIGHFDLDEVCTFANDRGLKALGVRREQIPGITLREALGEDNYRQHEPGIREALAGRYASMEGVSPFNGGDFHFQAHMVPDRDQQGKVRGFYLMTFDVTALKQYQIALAAGEDRLRTITDNLPVLIAYIDREHRFQFANGTFRDWLDVDPAAIVGRRVLDVVGPSLYEERRLQIDQALSGKRVDFEMQSVTRGVLRHLQTSYLPDLRPDGSVLGIYTMSTDVTVLKLAEQQMRQLARFDSLTSLPNRLQFEEKLPEAMARCARSKRPIALMFLDVDKFKTINDSLGHSAGDEVLKEFAHRLQSCVRKTDTVARLAGDEFVVILEGLNSIDEPQFVARKIIATVGGSDFAVAGGRVLSVSTSLGISLYEGGDISPARLLARADEALYEAKAAGRNTFRMAGRLA
ncbi:MAG TPA: diguanylate cyclase [Candidatus Aquabacterium excrementipullorum]|nr:diguanylate cyclase [Candidatus Aquabacterium excrementipullorum]